MSPAFCDSTITEQLPCHKRPVNPPLQKCAANGRFHSRDRDFSAIAVKYSIQLLGFGFDGDGFTFGVFCEHEFQDAVL
jgi:hypothetical protein